MSKVISVVLVLLTMTLFGCNIPTDGGEASCTGEARPGLAIHVNDAQTGDVLVNVHAVAKDGAFVDSSYSDNPDVPTVFLAYERPAVYEVIVQREGYQTWRQEGVTVSDGACHVLTRSLAVTLAPE